MEKKKILVVDDEEIICDGIKMNLEENGSYEVEIQTRGANAHEDVLSLQPDLVILDYIMPDMNGGEVAAQLQGDKRTRDVPIIFLTATVLNKGKQQELFDGKFKMIPKPITTKELIDNIEEVLKLK